VELKDSVTLQEKVLFQALSVSINFLDRREGSTVPNILGFFHKLLINKNLWFIG